MKIAKIVMNNGNVYHAVSDISKTPTALSFLEKFNEKVYDFVSFEDETVGFVSVRTTEVSEIIHFEGISRR